MGTQLVRSALEENKRDSSSVNGMAESAKRNPLSMNLTKGVGGGGGAPGEGKPGEGREPFISPLSDENEGVVLITVEAVEKALQGLAL